MTMVDWIKFGMRCVATMFLIALALIDPLRAIALVAVILVLPRSLEIPEKAIRGRQIERSATMLVLLATFAGAWLIATYAPLVF